MGNNFRSGCPIASTLDVIGDKWSMLVIRDILFHHRLTFKEFSAADEQIAPSILSARLKLLTDYGLITKRKLPSNKKENVYLLTTKGLELTPILVDISVWGDKNLRQFNEINEIEGLNLDRNLIIETIKNRYETMMNTLEQA